MRGTRRSGTDRDGRGDSGIQVLRNSRVESRAVLDHRIALLDEIDDNAQRTVRTSLVVIALLVSASQIAGPSWVRSLNRFAGAAFVLAVVLFSFSIVSGMAIYSVSLIPYGIGPAHRLEAIDGYHTEREWLALSSNEYDEWTAEVRALTENNARWPIDVQGAFVGGVMLVATAVAVSTSTVSIWRGGFVLVVGSAVALLTMRRAHRSRNA